MKRRISGREAQEDWERLWRRSPWSPDKNNLRSKTSTTVQKDDPFDCSDVAISTPWERVEEVVQDYQRKWEQLDDRKIVEDEEDATTTTMITNEPEAPSHDSRKVHFADNNNIIENPSRKRKPTGWMTKEDRLRLPFQFDYATTGPEPVDDGTQKPRVISLLGLISSQSQSTVSYERELWRLFATIPSAQNLETEIWEGAQVSHTRAIQKEIASLPRSCDGHLLLRLRSSDRHGLPPPPLDDQSGHRRTTLTFECWRRQPYRSPAPDPHRMVLEFLGTQTLLNFHSSLIQLHEDRLWDEAKSKPPGSSDTETATDTGKKKGIDSGCFFLENTFYEHGSTDYAKPIQDWLDGGLGRPRASRRGAVGITTMNHPLHREPMGEIQLQDLPLRLGVRYYHVCHGDVETSFFLTDRRWTSTDTPSYNFPILHDIWTLGKSASSILKCEACVWHSAAWITKPGTAMTDGQSVPLCPRCAITELEIPPDQRELVSTWWKEKDLSVSLGRKDRQLQ